MRGITPREQGMADPVLAEIFHAASLTEEENSCKF
jgi:hypothetical protein